MAPQPPSVLPSVQLKHTLGKSRLMGQRFNSDTVGAVARIKGRGLTDHTHFFKYHALAPHHSVNPVAKHVRPVPSFGTQSTSGLSAKNVY